MRGGYRVKVLCRGSLGPSGSYKRSARFCKGPEALCKGFMRVSCQRTRSSEVDTEGCRI